MHGSRVAFLALVAVGVAACDRPAEPPPEPAAGCNPLGDACATPFPSSFYQRADATSATGVRVAIPEGVLPVSQKGIAISPARINGRDGFSPATSFVAYFEGGVDAKSLPPLGDAAASVAPTSSVQLFDFATGERVPLIAEIDLNAQPTVGERQAVLIHPLVRLKPGTRYVVALAGLLGRDGAPASTVGFRALRDGAVLSNALAGFAPRYEELFAFLATKGLARASLSLAWDVTTASDYDATGHLEAMRDEALGRVAAGTLGYKVTASSDPADPHLFRAITGSFDVPSFLASDAVDAMMNFGADGKPAVRALGSANFVIHVPQCARAAKGPLPVMVFGHGLFGSADGELSSDYLKSLGDTLCMIQIGTDWIGLAMPDVGTVASKVLPDFNNISIITDRLQQAHVNAQVLAALFVKKMKDDPLLALDGKPITDGSEMYYYGISDGGIQGGTFMALAPGIVRGVLNVPGANLSLLMYRSGAFRSLKLLIGLFYGDPLDHQLLITLSQSEWDRTDPISFVPHLLANPLSGVPLKRILVQESIDDATVPNVATEVMARTMGLPGMDLERPVFGIPEKTGPLDSAYTQWDSHPTPVPAPGNVPPQDNGAHEAARRMPVLIQQLGAFFRPDGRVESLCPKRVCSF